jgi:hypothetical protein
LILEDSSGVLLLRDLRAQQAERAHHELVQRHRAGGRLRLHQLQHPVTPICYNNDTSLTMGASSSNGNPSRESLTLLLRMYVAAVAHSLSHARRGHSSLGVVAAASSSRPPRSVAHSSSWLPPTRRGRVRSPRPSEVAAPTMVCMVVRSSGVLGIELSLSSRGRMTLRVGAIFWFISHTLPQ